MRSWVQYLVPLLLAASQFHVFAAADDPAARLQQALEQMPTCALSCIVKTAPEFGCALTNGTCLCATKPLRESLQVCFSANCTAKEELQTTNITATACGAPVRNLTHRVDAVNIALPLVALVTVLIRCWFRLLIMKQRLGIDDWLVVATIVMGVYCTMFNVWGLGSHGIARDVWTLPFDDIYLFGKYFYFATVGYFAEITLLKLSMLFFFLRIFPSPGVRRVVWCTIVFTAVFGIFYIFFSLFRCAPISYDWTGWDGDHEGHCFGKEAMAWSNASISIALDFWMLAIPLSQLYHLKMHWKKKVAVGMMFFVGTFVTIVSIVRLKSLVKFTENSNTTWYNQGVSVWSSVEVSIGVVCACMPTMRLVLAHYAPRVMASTTIRTSTGRKSSRGHSRLGLGADGSSGQTARGIPLSSLSHKSRNKNLNGASFATVTCTAETDSEMGLPSKKGPLTTTTAVHISSNNDGGRDSDSDGSTKTGNGGGSNSSSSSGGVGGGHGGDVGAGGIVQSTTYRIDYDASEFHDEAHLVFPQQAYSSQSGGARGGGKFHGDVSDGFGLGV